MKFNKEEFRQFILAEAKKVAIKEGWIKEENNSEEIQYEDVEPTEEIVQEAKEQTKEVKQLSEEIQRMKQLLDFRNPVLGEKK